MPVNTRKQSSRYRPVGREDGGGQHGNKRCCSLKGRTRFYLFTIVLIISCSILLSLGNCWWYHFFNAMFGFGDNLLRLRGYYAGRVDMKDPSPRCCHGQDCVPADHVSRKAVVTILRTDDYLPLVAELACSLNKTNPKLLPLYVYTVRGDLSPYVEEAVSRFAELRHWETDFRLPNYIGDGRYELSWVKLRAWELTDFDVVLLLDADVSIMGDISPLFTLPTHFAAVPDQQFADPALRHGSLGHLQGGVIVLRPCPAIAQHMGALLMRDRLLQYQYAHAEQDFLDWYFKFDRWLLPIEYNSLQPMTLGSNQTLSGTTAKIVHFTQEKPFVRSALVPQHRYLCSGALPEDLVSAQQQVQQRAQMQPQARSCHRRWQHAW